MADDWTFNYLQCRLQKINLERIIKSVRWGVSSSKSITTVCGAETVPSAIGCFVSEWECDCTSSSPNNLQLFDRYCVNGYKEYWIVLIESLIYILYYNQIFNFSLNIESVFYIWIIFVICWRQWLTVSPHRQKVLGWEPASRPRLHVLKHISIFTS